jgi:hypothetical protein
MEVKCRPHAAYIFRVFGASREGEQYVDPTRWMVSVAWSDVTSTELRSLHAYRCSALIQQLMASNVDFDSVCSSDSRLLARRGIEIINAAVVVVCCGCRC